MSFSSKAKIAYNNYFSLSSRFGQGWIKYDPLLQSPIITTSRILRDIEEDKTRTILEQYIPTQNCLHRLPTSSCELNPVALFDFSPSGMKSITIKNNKDDIPILEFSGTDTSSGYRIDASKLHGKVIGDTWFGGCSWSSDERFVAYVACKKPIKRGTYFNEEIEESQSGNYFDFIDDWGEKYTGISTLVICILDTLLGKISIVTGPEEDSEKWTIGQPCWVPFSIDTKSLNSDPVAASTSTSSGMGTVTGTGIEELGKHSRTTSSPSPSNSSSQSPSSSPRYTLVYTAWQTGSNRLGMIYCYNRPCSIFSVDLTNTLTQPPPSPSPSPSTAAPTTSHTTEPLLASDVESDTNSPLAEDLTSTKTMSEAPLGPVQVHTCLTPSLTLARSPRVSPNGKTLLCLGRKERVLTHNMQCQLFRISLPDTLSSPAKSSSYRISTTEPETIIDLVHNPTSEHSFPGLFTDQLPRRCFLPSTAPTAVDGNKDGGDGDDDEGVVLLSTQWGVTDSIVAIDLKTRVVMKLNKLFDILSPEPSPDSDARRECVQQALDESSLTSSSASVYGRGSVGIDVGAVLLDVLSVPHSSASAIGRADSRTDGAVGKALLLFQSSSPVQPQRLGLLELSMPLATTSLDSANSRVYRGTPVVPTSVTVLKAKPPASSLFTTTTGTPPPTPTTPLGIPSTSAKGTLPMSWRVLTLRAPLPPPSEAHGGGGGGGGGGGEGSATGESCVLESLLMIPNPVSDPTSGPLPLVVVPHGGPHSAFTSSYLASTNFLCEALHAGILLVNFRGSTGFGSGALEALPGHIGDMDVCDVMAFTQLALRLTRGSVSMTNEAGEVDSAGDDKLLFDGSRVAVVGGSHGGFLAAHLTGQHPDLYRVAALRNPVVDLSSMLGTSDIPDWCVVEAGIAEKRRVVDDPLVGGENSGRSGDASESASSSASSGVGGGGGVGFDPMVAVSAEAVVRLWQCSPVKHAGSVRAPTLLLLGAKDRRVPASQGLHFHNLLKARGVPTKLQLFPEDSHAIDRPKSEADQWLAITAWLGLYL